MLNFRNVNMLFIILLLFSIGTNKVYGIPFFVYIILALVYGGLLFYGCFYVGSNYFIPITCSLKTDEKIIAISFDDGPDAINSPQILQLLKDHHIETTFFYIGNRIACNEAIVRQADADGHTIGNHTFSHHYWFDLFSAKKMTGDMAKMDEAISEVIGKTPKLFRPPYGVTNPNIKKAITNRGYTPIGWSVRSLDTVITDETKLLNKLIKKLQPGAIYLFHDTSKTTLTILPAFLNHVQLNGYHIIRLDKMLNLQAYA